MNYLTSIIFHIALVVMLFFGCANEQAELADENFSPEQIYDQAIAFLDSGHQTRAERLLKKHIALFHDNPQIVFLQAACSRSRFQIRRSASLFKAVKRLDADSAEGRCATLVLDLDKHKNVEQNFKTLQQLVDQHPEKIIVRWMLAVQCRSHNRNQEGVRQYKKILQTWDPGPALVHQTYGNVLDALERYEEALVERRLTVQLAPAGWSYQGLGNTLTSMNRFDEANLAHAKSVELAPNNANYWDCWAWGLLRQRKLTEAIEKCKKAIELDPQKHESWARWGRCLELMGQKVEAVKKFQTAIKINPNDHYARCRAAKILHQLGRHQEAHAIE